VALAVILDMDGLMLDTEPISLGAWKEAAVGLGYGLDDEVCVQMIGLGLAANRDLLRRHFGDDFPVDELTASANRLYRRQLDAGGVPHKPGLAQFLRFLDARRIPRAVATSTETRLATHKLHQAGVLSHFEVIVGGDQVKRGKPDPDIFLMAAARLGCRPEDCAVLEDSGPGILAAAAAGMRAILIPDGRDPGEEIRRVAHAVVGSLLEANAVIERLMDDDAKAAAGVR
jgi:HAD superfamily hydrolase (TIGR01509 family)